MKKNLSPTAQMIQSHLERLGKNLKVIEFQETTRTSADAASRVGCKIGQIVKSLVFKGQVDEKPVLILTSGANRVDVQKVANLVGEPIVRADAEYVRKVTGFAIGGIPPVGHSTSILTFMDEDLYQYDSIWAAAGTPNAVFELSPQDLQTITSARVASIRETIS
jgi:Cys-tRNA(Pro) deacylase